MKPLICAIGILVAAALLMTPAVAWGPITQQAIVTTAVRMLSKEGVTPLSRLEKDVRDGASAAPEVAARVLGGLATGPVSAIENEMNGLEAVRGDEVDPYFAYRLGVLGQLVAQIASPLADAKPATRDKYYHDVDENIQQTPLKTSPRVQVDPVPYFERLHKIVNARADMVAKEYQEGVGFGGVAKLSLSDDVSHSLDAVADVWTTVLTGKAVHATVSDSEIRDYFVGAFDYYIARGNDTQIDATYKRLAKATSKIPEMSKRIGDLFYEGKLYDRAISEYQQVLAVEPQRKDVIEKVTEYYMKVGEDAEKGKHLQPAYDAYAKAAQVNPLHPTAEAKRLELETMIAERDARLETAHRTNEEATRQIAQAEQSSQQHKYAEAMTALKDAQTALQTITNEFPREFQIAATGLSRIDERLRDLKRSWIQNAQSLSGSGTTFEVARAAASGFRNIDERALRALEANQLNAELRKLKASYQDKLASK